MRGILIALCVLWMGFIFYMSSNNGEISHEKSSKVVDFVENVRDKIKNDEEKNKIVNENPAQNQKMKEDKLDFIVRKNAHAFLYMVLAILVGGSFFSYDKKGKNAIIHILFICLFYSVTDEYHQSFIVGRTSSVNDILFDFVGAVIGVFLLYIAYYIIYERYLNTRRKQVHRIKI